jgi:hypothetical protein
LAHVSIAVHILWEEGVVTSHKDIFTNIDVMSGPAQTRLKVVIADEEGFLAQRSRKADGFSSKLLLFLREIYSEFHH